MNTIKKYMWLIAILMVALFSCKDNEDVNGSDNYYYTTWTSSPQFN